MRTQMKLLIVEDHTLLRELVVWACREAYPDGTIEEANDGKTALAKCRALQPELILLDLVLPDSDGLELLPEMRALVPEAKVIALSSHTDEVTLMRTLAANVNGFVDKSAQSVKVLREAIQAVMQGQRYLSPVVHETKSALRSDPKAFDKVLSAREQQILTLLGHGLSNEEVGARVGLSALTIHSHRQRIMQKLDIHSVSALILYAIAKGFSRPGRPAAKP